MEVVEGGMVRWLRKKKTRVRGWGADTHGRDESLGPLGV